ncbi:DNRLRE domain-containing protein [Streptomyces exfoliatus]|uniref:DNRLRE domain-containing protein n=1 Tax=Streptomyces exfoliatus TaxID=1905 RepID=UPI003798650F
MTQNGDAVDLTLTPDAEFLADPETKFPVMVDPAVNIGASFDTFVQQGYTTDMSTSTELKLGNNGSGQIARSFMHFPMAQITGKHILSAKLNLWNFHSWSCTPTSWEVWDTPHSSTSSRWTAQPNWNIKWAASTATKGVSSSCAEGWVSQDIKNLAVAWAANGNGSNAMGIRATTESDPYSWKRFNSGNAPTNTPYVSVTFNSTPDTATAVSPLSGTYTSDTTPTLSAKATDTDAQQLTLSFETWAADGTAALRSGTSAAVASGAVATHTVAALTPGTYKWRARAADGTDVDAWSAWQTFTVDTTVPSTPTITSTSHPSASAWYNATTFAGVLAATDASGVTGYAVKLDQSPTTAAGTAVTETGTAVSWSGRTDGTRST